ncbi:hypothetical protein HY844_02080 [Candidatus Berkelbacteria bacterium]|nr:hypothetical protein [Candidatus Berkelbacteria bacterium]
MSENNLTNSSKNIENTEPVTDNKKEANDLSYKIADSWEASNNSWMAVVLSRKPINNNELIDIAKKLRDKYPKNYFQFFDDDKMVNEYKEWDVNYGKVFDVDGVAKLPTDCKELSYCINKVKNSDAAYPFPEDWDKEHGIAMLNEVFVNGSKKWQLSLASFETIYTFE